MEERIARLERQCWWYRNLFALLLVGIVAGVGLGVSHQGVPKVIRVNSLEVVTHEGKTVGMFAALENYGGSIALYGPKGIIAGGTLGKSVTISLGSSASGGAISIKNADGERVVQLYADKYGNGVVYAGNRKGKGRTLKPGP